MDASRDRTTEPDRVNEIRREIEGIRSRIASTIDALAYKADVPSRLADVLSSTASTFTARVLHRFPGRSDAGPSPTDGGVSIADPGPHVPG